MLPGVVSDAPWIAARTSMVNILWGIEHVPPDPKQAVSICENYIDAALITQKHGEYAVAAGGARTLKEYEIAALRTLNPHTIVLAYDNDLVGQAGPVLRAQLQAEWAQSKAANQVPQSNAFAVVADLKSAGLRTFLFPWPEAAPHKADVMWALEHSVM